jgi:toxin ParE1/3/4
MAPAKAIVLRSSGQLDVDEAIDFYRREAGQALAISFVDALERAYRLISEQPGAGSSRYAHALDLLGLRSWPLRDYPFVVFYFEQETHVEIWRVLHAARDIPASITDGGA